MTGRRSSNKGKLGSEHEPVRLLFGCDPAAPAHDGTRVEARRVPVDTASLPPVRPTPDDADGGGRHGVKRPGRPIALDAAQRAAIAVERETGMSYGRLAAKYNVHPDTIRNALGKRSCRARKPP